MLAIVQQVEIIAPANFAEFDRAMNNFVTALPLQGEDIFKFYARLKRIQGLFRGTKFDYVIPTWQVTWKLLVAASKYPKFQIIMHHTMTEGKRKWMELTPDELME